MSKYHPISRRQLLARIGAGIGALLLPESARGKDCAVKIPVYLTIDDGPSQNMRNIVDVLGNKAKATFFLIGQHLADNSSRMNGLESARYAIEHGHDLGNHSYSHPWFSFLTLDKAKDQINKTRELIEKAYAQAGKTAPLFFRFPYGDNGHTSRIKEGKVRHIGSPKQKQELADLLQGMGYSTYNWAIVDYPVLSGVNKPGAVILTHDWPNGLGVRISRKYLASGKFDLQPLPRPAIPQYEVRYL